MKQLPLFDPESGLPTLRHCKDCGQDLPVWEFYKVSGKNSLFPWCKKCHSTRCYKRTKERLQSDPDYRDRYNDYHRKYQKRPGIASKAQAKQKQRYRKCIDWYKEWQRSYRQRHPEVHQQSNQKRRDRLAELPNTFTDDQKAHCFQWWNNQCAYCGRTSGESRSSIVSFDHWIPIVDAMCPGTIACNMLPTCVSCNASKQNTDPLTWLISRFGEDQTREIVTRIETYFSSL